MASFSGGSIAAAGAADSADAADADVGRGPGQLLTAHNFAT